MNNHPYKFCVYRVLCLGSLYHVTSLYEGYNDNEHPKSGESETRLKKYVRTDDLEEVLDAVIRSANTQQTQYVCTTLTTEILETRFRVVH